jgi:hypothetical protein
MTLDLTRLARLLESSEALEAKEDYGARLEALRGAYEHLDDDELRNRLRTARTSWLLATSERGYRSTYAAPEVSVAHTVIATDGSSIAPDRHSPLRYYVTNLGLVRIRYGHQPDAEIRAEPVLCADESCLFAPTQIRRIPVAGQLFGLKRQCDELRASIDLARPDDPEPVILQDGSLIFWGLENQPDVAADWILKDVMRTLEVCRERRVPVAGFISYPGATDLMNSLRVSVCDYPPAGRHVNCDHCRARIEPEGRVPACDVLPNVPDRVLWQEVAGLVAGERSEVFASTSQILQRYRTDHWIMFFYVNVGAEIARVEIPRWVADDGVLLDRVHSVVLDQCEKGRGYPIVLQEAHEAAVIRGSERRGVETMIERALSGRGVFYRRSAKDGSKRVRFV